MIAKHVCPACREEFTPRSGSQIYCCSACRGNRYHDYAVGAAKDFERWAKKCISPDDIAFELDCAKAAKGAVEVEM